MKKLRINRASARDFGRLGNESVDLTGSEFMVVTGPNEAGKTTLADMLSWVLAGRRRENESPTRFVDFRNQPSGATSVTIAGQIDGALEDQQFSVNRSFIIRLTNKGKEPEPPTPTIFLDGGQLPPEKWGQLIGVLDGDQFYSQYRITGPYDPDNQVDVMVLLEALTVGTSVAVPAREVVKSLEEQADKLVHSVSGRNAGNRRFKLAADDLEQARKRLREIEGDFVRSTGLEDEIRTVEEEQSRLDEELRGLREEQTALKTASELFVTAVDLETAVRELEHMEVLDDSLRGAHAAAEDISTTVGRLEIAITEESTTEQNLNSAVRRVGIDLLDAQGVLVPEGTFDSVNELLSDRRTAENAVKAAAESAETSRARLGNHEKELGVLASELRTSPEHLQSLGNLTLDDLTFGDPLRKWVEAEHAVPSLMERSRSTTAREDSCRREFEEVDQKWRETGLTVAPQSVTEGQVPSVVSGRSPQPAGLALVVLMTAAAAYVHRAVGVAVALVGLGIIWGMSRGPKARAGSVDNRITRDVISLAEDWVGAKEALDTAVGAKREAELALADHRGQLAGHMAVARSALESHGFGDVSDVNLAAMVRAERDRIRQIVRSIKDESETQQSETGNRTRNEQKIAQLDADLVRIADEIGLGSLGNSLTVERVQNAREVQSLTSRLNTARIEVTRLWDELHQLAGPWSVGLSLVEIKRRMAGIAVDARARESREETRKQAQRTLESRAPHGSRAAEVLGDPAMTPDVLNVRLEELEREVSDKTSERDEALRRSATLEEQLRTLARKDDLPLVQQEVAQAESELGEVAVRGAALLLAAKIVHDVKDEVERSNQPAVIKRASDLVRSITGGQWTGLAVAEDGEIAVGQNGLWMDQDSLSAGARDVLRLCVRIAFAEHHAEKTGVALPLILDDPSASVDDARAPRLFEVLADFSTRHQVILMTHDPVTTERALSVGAAVVHLWGRD